MGSIKGSNQTPPPATGYEGGLDPSKQAGGAAGTAGPAKGRSMNENGIFAKISPASKTQFNFEEVMKNGQEMAEQAHQQWQNLPDLANLDWKEYDQQRGLGNADQNTLASKEKVHGESDKDLLAFAQQEAVQTGKGADAPASSSGAMTLTAHDTTLKA